MTFPPDGGVPSALIGNEVFTDAGAPLTLSVLDYWQWSESDLAGRAQHAKIAEFLVAFALGATQTAFDPELPYTLLDPRGIELVVSTHSDVNDWDHYKAPPIAFHRYPYSIPGVPFTEEAPEGSEPAHHHRVHVFSLLVDTNPKTVNPLDVSQWRFYVVPTSFLSERWPGEQKVSLDQLATSAYGNPVAFAALSDAVATRA